MSDLIEIYGARPGNQFVDQMQGYKESLVGAFAVADAKLRSGATDKAAVENEAVGRVIDVFKILAGELPNIAKDLKFFPESAARTRAMYGDPADQQSGIHYGQPDVGIHSMIRNTIAAELSPGPREASAPHPVFLLDDPNRADRNTERLKRAGATTKTTLAQLAAQRKARQSPPLRAPPARR